MCQSGSDITLPDSLATAISRSFLMAFQHRLCAPTPSKKEGGVSGSVRLTRSVFQAAATPVRVMRNAQHFGLSRRIRLRLGKPSVPRVYGSSQIEVSFGRLRRCKPPRDLGTFQILPIEGTLEEIAPSKFLARPLLSALELIRIERELLTVWHQVSFPHLCSALVVRTHLNATTSFDAGDRRSQRLRR